MKTYEVTVGNIGTVYRGTSKRDAKYAFKYYVQQSQENIGRGAGENVTYWENDEPVLEFEGVSSETEIDSRRDKNKLDSRISIAREYTGHISGKPQYVVRFLGDWIGSSSTRAGAIRLAKAWEDDR